MKYNLHHIGYLVKSIDKYRKTALENLLEIKEYSKITEDPIQKVKVQFAKLNDSTYIELVEPVGKDSPLFKTLKDRGEGIYHLCYEVDNIDQCLEELQEKRCLVIQNPVHAAAFDNRRISFIFTRNKDLIELLEKKSG